MILDIKNREWLNPVQLTLTFNFFSNKSAAELAEKAGPVLNRKMEVGATREAWQPIAEGSARLTNLYNKGFRMKRLTIGPVYYYEGINTLIKGLKFIQENGYTNELCTAKVDIGFSKMKEGSRIEQLNKFKFLLNFNEAKAFELWPQNTKSNKLYKSTPKLVYPKNKFVAESTYPSGTAASQLDFNFPAAKNFGIDFSRLGSGFISVKYIGGKDYEKRLTEAVDVVNLVAESTFGVLNANREYSESETTKIREILKEQRDHLVSLKSYETFSQKYPMIKLAFDLKTAPEAILANFQLMQEGLFNLVTYGNLLRGKVNYNSTTGQLEVLEARIRGGFNLSNIVFIGSSIQAELSGCSLINCQVRSSNLTECTLIDKNDIRYSTLNDCSFNQQGANLFVQSTIKGQPAMQVAGELKECLVVGSPLAWGAIKDSKTELAL